MNWNVGIVGDNIELSPNSKTDLELLLNEMEFTGSCGTNPTPGLQVIVLSPHGSAHVNHAIMSILQAKICLTVPFLL